MNPFQKDVLTYSIVSMLELAEDNSEYDFYGELNDFKNSDFFKSLNINTNELNLLINNYIKDLSITKICPFEIKE